VSCPHPSIPVEMDESMTTSSLNLAWPVCKQCSAGADGVSDMVQVENPKGYVRHPKSGSEVIEPACCATPTSNGQRISNEAGYLRHPQHPPSTYAPYVSGQARRLRSIRVSGDLCCVIFVSGTVFAIHNRRNSPIEEDEESLEMPLPLRSDIGDLPYRLVHQLRHPGHPGYLGHGQVPANGQGEKGSFKSMGTPLVTTPHSTAPAREVMSEMSVLPSLPVAGHNPFQEARRTISLPDDCRTVFITYSVDTAKEIFPFVRFLINQGFRPAIDIFDTAVRQMDVIKWMDNYLKDKSVLIIVVISPKYKVDVEGDGSDQHGLHTKYIYTQIQNEFIQQRCLNFRLVPVLFPNANQSHVPMWLQSTRLFHWPQDAQDLLLRLLREERYIPPPLGKELTLTIKPL
ncbi:hypothetical protein NFI96_017704, partial [Prochilodus magdalenae]